MQSGNNLPSIQHLLLNDDSLEPDESVNSSNGLEELEGLKELDELDQDLDKSLDDWQHYWLKTNMELGIVP